MTFYRYQIVTYAELGMDGEFVSSKIPNPQIELLEFKLTKETPKGYWLGVIAFPKYKWVSKTGKKRYAYPTKEEAMINFIKRTERRIEILERQLWSGKIALDIAKNMKI